MSNYDKQGHVHIIQVPCPDAATSNCPLNGNYPVLNTALPVNSLAKTSSSSGYDCALAVTSKNVEKMKK